MTDPKHTEPVEVTQADRDIADEYSRTFPELRLYEAFARHRTAAEAASRAREARLREALEGVATFLETAPLESGVCCCGDPIEGHGYHSGHSPVDQASYTAMLWAKDIRAALTASEGGDHG